MTLRTHFVLIAGFLACYVGLGATSERISDSEGSALRIAASQGDLVSVEKLLKQGVPVDDADPRRGFTALHNSASNGHLEIVRTLIKSGADPIRLDYFGESALGYAAGRGRLSVVRELIPYHPDERSRVLGAAGTSALLAATLGGHISIVELLLARGVDPTIKSHSGLSTCDWVRSLGGMQLLIVFEKSRCEVRRELSR